jgi:hypothetical protein
VRCQGMMAAPMVHLEKTQKRYLLGLESYSRN